MKYVRLKGYHVYHIAGGTLRGCIGSTCHRLLAALTDTVITDKPPVSCRPCKKCFPNKEKK